MVAGLRMIRLCLSHQEEFALCSLHQTAWLCTPGHRDVTEPRDLSIRAMPSSVLRQSAPAEFTMYEMVEAQMQRRCF